MGKSNKEIKDSGVNVATETKNKYSYFENINRTSKMDKLDNTANLFPVIVSPEASNVFRMSITLNEEIQENLLQQALDEILPFFEVFNVRLKKGIFWYYFEANNRPAPKVTKENTYPCLYINTYTNNDYMFKVTYFEKRINLEVFHVLTDGTGALVFLKELTYKYLRLSHPELLNTVPDKISKDVGLSKEDSYLKNYKKSSKKVYKSGNAVIIEGQMLPKDHFGIIHGYMNVSDVKDVTKKYGVTINQYLIAVYTWAVYKAYLNGTPSQLPISTCIPVNLRPYFNSNTMKNFFVVVSAIFKPEKSEYSFTEVLDIIKTSLDSQINKENLENIFSYNVSNEVNYMVRAIPRILKNLAMKKVYKSSAKANTSTISNVGLIKTVPEYAEYIDRFHMVLSMSKGQNLKGSICSYNNKLTFTFSSAIKETYIQKEFFNKLVDDGINVCLESNGVYYE